ncbi:MAG: flagellar basal body P-ring protein FlgI [Elusimicrobiales bacterium]|nr:flagellar basal body P-ring protein FlgI [Elusimicrobiales bacterium]
MKYLVIKVFLFLLYFPHLYSAKIKDVANFDETEEIFLTGYGIVTGLNSTGDRNLYLTQQAIGNMMTNLGISIPPQQLKTRNSASVIVTSKVKGIFHKGQKIDVEVSSIGDATSIDGGSLIRTALYDKYGNLVAFAQGVITSKSKKTTGFIPNGGEIYNVLNYNENNQDDKIKIFLRKPEYLTALRIEKHINSNIKEVKATAINSSTIEVSFSSSIYKKVELISLIGELEIESDTVAKIIINSATGDIIIHGRVEIAECSISVGDIDIEINSEKEEYNSKSLKVKSKNIMELIKALNQIKVKSYQIVDIIKTLHSAGFINGELEII